MRKGENIFKRKDGRWEARYVKGYEPSGKAKYGFCVFTPQHRQKNAILRLLSENFNRVVNSAKIRAAENSISA